MQEYMEFFQQNMILSVVWVGLFITIIMNLVKSSSAAYKEITTAELTQLVNKEEGIVVDIRSKEEFRKGHITDSVHLLPSDIKAGNLGSLEKSKSNPIIVICKSGQTAPESANLLAKAGFERPYILKDGLIAWNDAKLPLVRGKK